MGSRSSVPATPVLQDQAVLEHLERILASPGLSPNTYEMVAKSLGTAQ